MNNTCHICGSVTSIVRDPQLNIHYHVCDVCGFVYKDPSSHVTLEQEKQEYDQHENSFESSGYVAMFERFIEEFIRPLELSGVGLEFGSGPGPVLKELLSREGFEMYDYDHFYHPDKAYASRQYDLITTTEVVEHFTNPLEEFTHLASLLKEGGYLIVMTQFNTFNNEEFLTWWYRRDKTHISFYSVKTLEYLAKRLQIELMRHNHKNVVVFQKPCKS